MESTTTGASPGINKNISTQIKLHRRSIGGAQNEIPRAGKATVAVITLLNDTSVPSIAMLKKLWFSAAFRTQRKMNLYRYGALVPHRSFSVVLYLPKGN